eukprot:CAMPEP_0180220428 /NCGR_PEP_ID=MMETSP0987-20121128/19105_1 /TAXON_ID=697907 /ORGANISM="non described non described, Strain CCMP2293" /LENGTH=467 /DNA_ID=CAMNT_0022181315 /DNA_START=60 /DNA_END=1459 /DNA_ORIENTATION=+
MPLHLDSEGVTSRDRIDNFFRISERGSTIGTEIRAGLSSFLTLSYMLLVNPQVMGAAGIDPSDVVTATCLSCAIPTIIVGLFGNLPFVMAPGLGLSAYFTYGLVLKPGAGGAPGMTWEQALGCVFISGAIMLLLSVTFLVERAMVLVPSYVKLSTIIGIGMLLACIGFEQMGLVVHGEINDLFAPLSWIIWASLAGLIFIGALTHFDVKGAILMGVVSVSIVVWGGLGAWPTQIVELPDLSKTWMMLSFKGLDINAIPAVLTFLLVALFDCSGCLIGLSMKAGLIRSVGDAGNVPGGVWALIASSVGTMIAAVTGCSPIIIAVECTAGILDGGRTGLTALTAAALFLLSLFFAPLFGAVPAAASAPVLILIGSMMMREVGEIDWSQTRVALPSFLTIALMPMSHSISNGVWFGLGSAIALGIATHDGWKKLFPEQVPAQGQGGLWGDGDDEIDTLLDGASRSQGRAL